MKTLRLIGMAIIAVIMSVNFVACDDDEDSDNVSLIGKWKVDRYIDATNGVTTHYTYQDWIDDGGYPYLVFEEKDTYCIDVDGSIEEYSSYIYDENSKVLIENNGYSEYKYEVISLAKNKLILRYYGVNGWGNPDNYNETYYVKVN